MATVRLPHLTAEQITQFWENVNIKEDNECWEWRLSKKESGHADAH